MDSSNVCVSGYELADLSPSGIITLPSATARSIQLYSTDTSLYYTSGSITGKIYALDAGGTRFSTAGQFITFSIAFTAPCDAYTPITGAGFAYTGSTYTIADAGGAVTQTFTGFKAIGTCLTGYAIDSVSPSILTLPSATSNTLSFYSTDISLYYTSGSVSGNLYALKADGSTKYTTAG